MPTNEKATAEELWVLVEAGVEAVSTAYMGDRAFVRDFAPSLDRWLDDVKSFMHCERLADKRIAAEDGG
jgi:hypothetical protein